jgi:hypothetical protein
LENTEVDYRIEEKSNRKNPEQYRSKVLTHKPLKRQRRGVWNVSIELEPRWPATMETPL